MSSVSSGVKQSDMERNASTAKLEICESGEYDLTNSRFTAHGPRRSGFHCSRRTQIITIVLFVFLLLIAMGVLMAMFGPGSTDLEYKTAKLEGSPQGEDKTTEPSPNPRPRLPRPSPTESTSSSTQTPPVTCANTLEPITPESHTPKSTTLEPTTMEPTSPKSTTLEPTTMKPTSPESTTLEPTTPSVTPNVTCDVAIVGAGLAGLYVAKELTNKTKVCVFEKNERLGGRIYDHHFARAPNASVGLGAWGLTSEDQPYIGYTLLTDLDITTDNDGWHEHLQMHRSRGITVAKPSNADTSTLCDVLKARVFPSLSQKKFTNETCEELINRVTGEIKLSANFSTAGTYLSNYLTSEGAKLITEYYGVKTDYVHRIKPKGYIDFLKYRKDELGGEVVRPTRGMSAVVQALKKIVLDQRGDVYLDEQVLSINQKKDTFHLQTDKHLVSAGKVILAVPPVALTKIKGDVTEKVVQNAIFKSILSVPAFKGAAVYKDAWWESMLKPLQTFTSYGSCLGVTMPHENKKGENILYTVYAHGTCAEKWGVLEQQGPDVLETAVQQALREKFNNNTIPTPLKTQYRYWPDGALHFQKAGSNYTQCQVLSWAASPVTGQKVSLVGDAYFNYGYLCEHALKSAANVLHEVWNITQPSELQDYECRS